MPKKGSIIGKKIVAVNVGIPSFADDLESQGVKVEQVDWKPPAGGDEKMLKILEKLGID
jgi:FdrA protein